MPQKPEDNSGFAKSLRDVGPYLGLGLQLAVTIVALVLLGSWLDKKFQLGYLLTLIGGILGISMGIYNLIKTVNDLEKRDKDETKK
jgi:F0F1-type ATP synthase assembly protein I